MSDSIASTPSISLIVPLLNESVRLPSLLNDLFALDAQIIIVDGGSDDGSWEMLQEKHLNQKYAHFLITKSERGRAKQMNAGAKLATGDVLLFLHADSQLPSSGLSEIRKVSLDNAVNSHARHSLGVWGRFDVHLDSNDRGMRMVEFFINARSRISGLATGDQAIFISRPLFDRVGGFDQIDLMEDVAMSKKCRAIVSAYCSRLKVTTSARRWEQNGVWKTIFKMWWYRLAFILGVSPTKLQRGYRDIR